jgi:hypothetical protein
MLQLYELPELIVGDATDYKSGHTEERHIYMFNSSDEENADTCFTAIIFADNPEEISIYSKNEKDYLRIAVDVRKGMNTFYDSEGKMVGYFDEKDLTIYTAPKKPALFFREMAFLDTNDVPYAIITDDIENELTERYFSLPHMMIEFVEPEENNTFRNLILASVITLIL